MLVLVEVVEATVSVVVDMPAPALADLVDQMNQIELGQRCRRTEAFR